MIKKMYSALMLLMMSSMMLNAATDSDELAAIAPEEGCYASLRDYLFKKKTMFDDTDVMGGDESDQGDQGDQEPEEPEAEEPKIAAEDTDQEVALDDEGDDELAASDDKDDAEVAPEKEEPEVAPEGVLGVDDDGSMSGPAPVISPEEQAAMDEAEQNPDVALILQNFEDEDDFDEEALIGALLGAGVAAGLAALLAKKFMDMKKKKQAGNITVDGQPKVTADDGTSRRVQSGKIGTTIDTTPRRPAPGVPVRPVAVSVTDLPESNIRPGGTATVYTAKLPPALVNDVGSAILPRNPVAGDAGQAPLKAEATKYQRTGQQKPVSTPTPVKDPLAALRAKKRTGLPPAVAKEPSELEKALADREARAKANREAKVGSKTPGLPLRNLADDQVKQDAMKLEQLKQEEKKAKKDLAEKNKFNSKRKFVGKYGVKG